MRPFQVSIFIHFFLISIISPSVEVHTRSSFIASFLSTLDHVTLNDSFRNPYYGEYRTFLPDFAFLSILSSAIVYGEWGKTCSI